MENNADKKKAEEVLEAIRKAHEAEFNIKEETRPTGIIGITENELALIGIALIEKMDRTILTLKAAQYDPMKTLENFTILVDCNAVKDKIDKILNINR
jgi:hypothetical protein